MTCKSREIKFRAWSMHSAEGTMFFVGDKHGTTHVLDCCLYSKEGQPVTLMQFTGIKDCNGVDIYEGDILNTCNGSIQSISFGEYYFESEGYEDDQDRAIGFYFDQESEIKEGFSSPYGEIGYEVIGNIHENPELIP